MQTRHRALEFKGQPRTRVQRRGGRLCRDHQLHPALVELIHQVDKTPALIVLVAGHPRHARQHDRVKFPGQFDVVARRARAVAELGKLEPDHIVRQPARAQTAAVDLDILPAPRRPRRQALEAALQARLRIRPQRVVVEPRPLQSSQAVVVARIDVHDPGVGVEQRDGGQEPRALEPVFIQALGRDVGGGHQGDTALDDGLQKVGQDHRIADIADEKLVKADNPGLCREAIADTFEGVFLAFQFAEFAVHALHKTMKMHAQLALEGQTIVERIHQVGFAAPHPTPEIQPRLGRLGTAQTRAQAPQQTRIAPLASEQPRIQGLKFTHRSLLRRVVAEPLAPEVTPVALPGRHCRARRALPETLTDQMNTITAPRRGIGRATILAPWRPLQCRDSARTGALPGDRRMA